MVFTRPGGKTQSALARADIASGNATTTIRFVDRLKHMGGLSGTVTTAQGALDLTGISAARIGPTDFRELQWQLEWYTDTGSTAVTMTVNVTYNDDTTGNVTVSAVATSRAAGTYPILPAVAGRFIKAVTGVTLSATTGTAGSFGITVKRYLGSTVAHVGNMSAVADWAQLGLGPVQSDSCVTMEMLCVTTSTGTLRGHLAIAHG
jgi:hypothetical protein